MFMEKVKAVLFVFLVATTLSANAQETEYRFFGEHSKGKVYGSDGKVGYNTMSDMVEYYSASSLRGVTKVVENSKDVIITMEIGRCSFFGQNSQGDKPAQPRYLSVYYTDDDGKLNRMKIHFNDKGRCKQKVRGYVFDVSSNKVRVYKGKSLIYTQAVSAR